MRSRSICSTHRVPRQPGMHRSTLSKNKKKLNESKKNKKIIKYEYIPIFPTKYMANYLLIDESINKRVLRFK